MLASLLPAVLFQPHSRVFLLKLVAVAMLASLPGLLYLEFIRFKGQTLYDEYVINLFRLGIDRDCQLARAAGAHRLLRPLEAGP